jgi:hypothetical protein
MHDRASIPVYQVSSRPFTTGGIASVRFMPHQARQLFLRGIFARSGLAHPPQRRLAHIGPGPSAQSSSQPTNTIQK